MTHHTTHCPRRTALQTVTGAVVGCLAGCLSTNDTSAPSSGAGPIEDVAVEGTELVVKHTSADNVDQLNLIQPNGELFEQRTVAAGSQQASFSIGTAYDPGEYTVVALSGDNTLGERSVVIRPELQIQTVGLYRNKPDKPWDEVYGDTETNRLKNGEACVTVKNSGSGPDAVVELLFSGEVPNPVSDPRGNGIHEAEQVIIPPQKTVDLFSSSFPFGSTAEDGMGCSPDGNSGQFTVIVQTQVGGDNRSNSFDVQYTDSTEMSDCEISITEA